LELGIFNLELGIFKLELGIFNLKILKAGPDRGVAALVIGLPGLELGGFLFGARRAFPCQTVYKE
jgi:hypothetical protein